MTVIVAGKLIQKSDSLSELAFQALTYIDGGVQWLAWAMPNPQVSYNVADETTLLAQVQQGLHGSPLTLLPRSGLLVSPVKLMSLGSDQLRLLGQYETGDSSPAVLDETRRMLAAHQLLTAQQLGDAAGYLRKLGVASAPVFNAIDFNDRVALAELAALPPGPSGSMLAPLRQEAAEFAVQQARTVREFCDYYQVYLAHAGKLDALGSNAPARAQLASQALDTLLPLAFGALDCPQLPERLPAPAEVDAALRSWLPKGYKIGFARLSQAVLQIVTQTSFTTQTGSEAARLFEQYLSEAQAFLSVNRILESRLEQDGSSLLYTLRGGGQQARLHVNADRLLSLRSFGTWKAPEAAAAAPPSLSTPPLTESSP